MDCHIVPLSKLKQQDPGPNIILEVPAVLRCAQARICYGGVSSLHSDESLQLELDSGFTETPSRHNYINQICRGGPDVSKGWLFGPVEQVLWIRSISVFWNTILCHRSTIMRDNVWLISMLAVLKPNLAQYLSMFGALQIWGNRAHRVLYFPNVWFGVEGQ